MFHEIPLHKYSYSGVENDQLMISNERNFSLAINGERTCGQEIRNQNVTAVMSIANIVKSSLGPVGLDKMLVDNIGVIERSSLKLFIRTFLCVGRDPFQ